MTQMRIDIKDYVVKRITLGMVKNTNVSIKTIMKFVNNIEDLECSLGDGKINWNKAMRESDEEHEPPNFDNDGCAFEDGPDGPPLPLDEEAENELRILEQVKELELINNHIADRKKELNRLKWERVQKRPTTRKVYGRRPVTKTPAPIQTAKTQGKTKCVGRFEVRKCNLKKVKKYYIGKVKVGSTMPRVYNDVVRGILHVFGSGSLEFSAQEVLDYIRAVFFYKLHLNSARQHLRSHLTYLLDEGYIKRVKNGRSLKDQIYYVYRETPK